MANVRAAIGLLIPFLLVAQAADSVIDYSNLSPDAFKSEIETQDLILIEFFAPWCGHCKRLAPEYEEAAKRLAEDDPPVPLAKVDCTNESGGKDICAQNDVQGYPTIKIFRYGKASDYNDGRTSDSIVKKMRSLAGSTSKDFSHSLYRTSCNTSIIAQYFGYAILLYFILSILYRLSRGLWYLKLGSFLGFSERFRPKDDSWAVITGATDGIGLAYSHEFMKKGYNVLLISRNPQKLEAVKQELDSKSNKKGKEIRVYSADFSSTEIYGGLEDEIKRLPRVDVLINNVGMSYEHPEYFASAHLDKRNQQIINVNTISCSRMCFIVLPIMEQQKYGVVLNVSSFSALDPCPLLSIYAASKAFVDVFSRSIAYEYAKKGIIIQSVLPGFVATKMSKIRKAYWMAPTPEDYVKSQLKTVSLDGQTTGYWSHELQFYFTQHVFPIIYDRSLTSNIAFNQMKLLRHKALKKIQQ